jgi:potassium efflux system protein
MREEERGWLSEHKSARWLLMFLCVGVPVLLGAVALTGFYYTALQLSIHSFYTFSFVLLVLLMFAILRRWFVVTRRVLAIEQARRRREAAKAEEEGPSEQELIDEELDLVRIDAQTQKLLRSLAALALVFGLFFIWQEILPAFRILEQVELWETTQAVETTAGAEEGAEAAAETIQEVETVTLADLVFALVVVALTLAAVKNLPGLLEIILLSRMHLGSGERYAALAILRYILVAIGAFLAFKVIGIGWSNVQWLVAAIGLGLGFGLQEIFANFVSGLILLFERPVRVGDIVTIGDQSGVVSKIRIRATSVTNFDKKELVIPNKELITGQVTNWTLADNMLRLVLRVRVAYGSNPQLVIDTCRQILDEHPDVLAEPKSMVVFNSFGDSALDFDLYIYVRLENGFKVRTEINTAVHNRFQEMGIEIPFPQRDLHVRSGLESLQSLVEMRGAASAGQGRPKDENPMA